MWHHDNNLIHAAALWIEPLTDEPISKISHMIVIRFDSKGDDNCAPCLVLDLSYGAPALSSDTESVPCTA